MKIVFNIDDLAMVNTDGIIDEKIIDKLCRLLSNLTNSGVHTILVTAGAILLGWQKLRKTDAPDNIPDKQAAAAIGQTELMSIYQNAFDEYNKVVAQVLVTRDVITNEKMQYNANNTLDKLLELDIIPIINENDSVTTLDIEAEDNYPLAASVATVAQADLVIVILDIDKEFLWVENNKTFGNKIESREALYEKINEYKSELDIHPLNVGNFSFPQNFPEYIEIE